MVKGSKKSNKSRLPGGPLLRILASPASPSCMCVLCKYHSCCKTLIQERPEGGPQTLQMKGSMTLWRPSFGLILNAAPWRVVFHTPRQICTEKINVKTGRKWRKRAKGSCKIQPPSATSSLAALRWFNLQEFSLLHCLGKSGIGRLAVMCRGTLLSAEKWTHRKQQNRKTTDVCRATGNHSHPVTVWSRSCSSPRQIMNPFHPHKFKKKKKIKMVIFDQI